MSRELLFSVTASDCEWSITKGSGKGGQKRNKTSNAVHCFHRPSKAYGYSEETRSQHKNKELAFTKMANTAQFKHWCQMEFMRKSGAMLEIEKYVENELKKVRVEIKKDGIWIDENLRTSN